MAIERQGNFLGQQRVDVPHLRAIESAVAADFDLLAGIVLAGDNAYIVNGFPIVMSPSPVGGAATSLRISVVEGVVLHPLATEAGTIFRVPLGRTTEQLSSTNARVEGGWASNAVNYVGLDLRRAADATTADTVQFLDPTTSLEQPHNTPLARTLDYKIVISTTDFSATPYVCPIAQVTLNADGNVTAVTDARPMMYRLGSGGSSPNRANTFPFPGGRTETTTGDVFAGGDKAIGNLKGWMDAVMTRLWESNGGAYWYSSVTSTNVKMTRTGTPLANGEYFSWDLGSETLTWKGLAFVFPNSPGITNTVTDGSAVLTDNGWCLYVDLDFTQNTALTAATAQLAVLGTPAGPGIRQIIAWRVDDVIYTRDGNWPVGTLFQPATTTALGIVKLNATPTDSAAPVVATVDTVTGFVNAKGLTRGTLGLAAGAITIGNATNDTSVAIGRAAITTTIKGTLAVDTITGSLGVNIAVNQAVTITRPDDGTGLTVTGHGTGIGIAANGGATNGYGIIATGGGTTGVGLQGSGGSSSGNGVEGIANGASFGVLGSADHANGAGVKGLNNTGAGVRGQGGSYGGVFNGTVGALCTGDTTGEGVRGRGGFTDSSIGGIFESLATNGDGLQATGAGTGVGATITGGATGKGLVLKGGGTSGVGLDVASQGGNSDAITALADGSGRALYSPHGGIQLDTGNITTTVGLITGGSGLKATGSTGGNGLLVATGDATVSTGDIIATGGDITAAAGAITASTKVTAPHFISPNHAPSLNDPQGHIFSSSYGLDSSDMGGNFSMTVDNVGLTAGQLFEIHFATAFSQPVKSCVLFPGNAATAALWNSLQFFVDHNDLSNTGVTISGQAIIASTTLKINYVISA